MFERIALMLPINNFSIVSITYFHRVSIDDLHKTGNLCVWNKALSKNEEV